MEGYAFQAMRQFRVGHRPTPRQLRSRARRISFSLLSALHELDEELSELECLLFAKLDRIAVFFLELQEDGSCLVLPDGDVAAGQFVDVGI